MVVCEIFSHFLAESKSLVSLRSLGEKIGVIGVIGVIGRKRLHLFFRSGAINTSTQLGAKRQSPLLQRGFGGM